MIAIVVTGRVTEGDNAAVRGLKRIYAPALTRAIRRPWVSIAGALALFAVALLLFETFDSYDRARLAFRDRSLLLFGAETGPLQKPNYAQLRFTRVAGEAGGRDIYSPLQEGWISPSTEDSSGRPIWEPKAGTDDGDYSKGAKLGQEIRTALAAP
eukprot:gene32770-33560_t